MFSEYRLEGVGVGGWGQGVGRAGPDLAEFRSGLDPAAELSLPGTKYLNASVAALAETGAASVAWGALVVVPLVMRFTCVAGKMA